MEHCFDIELTHLFKKHHNAFLKFQNEKIILINSTQFYFIGCSCVACNQSSIAGGVMKSTTGWNPPNTGATNSSGFSGLPGGAESINNGAFNGIGVNGLWFSTTEYGTDSALSRGLNCNESSVNRLYGTKNFGLSVRCVKD
jgi:uncharacterized protein (TIGR02145 family)